MNQRQALKSLAALEITDGRLRELNKVSAFQSEHSYEYKDDFSAALVTAASAYFVAEAQRRQCGLSQVICPFLSALC